MIVDRFLLVPHGPTTCLVLRYVEQDLHEHGNPIEVRGRWFGAIGEDSMQVVIIDDDGRRLRLFELGEDTLHETKAPPLPVGVVADSVVLSDALMFLGCHSDEEQRHLQREKLFALDLRAADSDWHPAPMWYDSDGFNPRKSIDELFVDGDRLLAIDDFVFPRYSLIYAIHERTKLELVKVVQMEDHTTYESVRAATLGRRWLAVISAGVNHGVSMKFVTVLERESLAERICYDYCVDWFGDSEPQTSGGIVDSTGLVFVGDVLMLAGGEAGLGIIDLRDYEPSMPKPDEGVGPGPDVRYRPVEGLTRVDRVLCMRGRDLCVAIELVEQGQHRRRCLVLSDDALASW
jgi:hypothetical protein